MIRRRWQVAIRGTESGTIHPMGFYAFRNEGKARRRVAELNAKPAEPAELEPLTEYVVWDSKTGAVA